MASSSLQTLCVPAPIPATRADFTLAEPLPLTPYTFDASLSEDENFLTWVTILTRHSTSRKGHMGTLFVRPPASGDPATETCMPDAQTRLLVHANNTPILYASAARNAPEIHAEALAISRAARFGLALAGCTVYVTFPPCNECAKLLLAVGVGRVVFRKCFVAGAKESVLAAARAQGVEMCGTGDELYNLPAPGESPQEAKQRQEAFRMRERDAEDAREKRVKAIWEAIGDDAQTTRQRVNDWWDTWMALHRAKLRELWREWGGNGDEGEKRAQEEEREKKKQKEARKKGKGRQDEEMDLDELRNESETVAASSNAAAPHEALDGAHSAAAPLVAADASQAAQQAGQKRRSSDLSTAAAEPNGEARASPTQPQSAVPLEEPGASPPRKISRV